MELLAIEIRDQVRSVLEWTVPADCRRVIEIEPEAGPHPLVVLLFFGRAIAVVSIELEWDADEVHARLDRATRETRATAAAIEWDPATAARGGDGA